MSVEKLVKSNVTTLTSEDDFGWEISVYEDQTEITYFELDKNGLKVYKQKFSITPEYDAEVFEEALKLIKAREKM